MPGIMGDSRELVGRVGRVGQVGLSRKPMHRHKILAFLFLLRLASCNFFSKKIFISAARFADIVPFISQERR